MRRLLWEVYRGRHCFRYPLSDFVPLRQWLAGLQQRLQVTEDPCPAAALQALVGGRLTVEVLVHHGHLRHAAGQRFQLPRDAGGRRKLRQKRFAQSAIQWRKCFIGVEQQYTVRRPGAHQGGQIAHGLPHLLLKGVQHSWWRRGDMVRCRPLPSRGA